MQHNQFATDLSPAAAMREWPIIFSPEMVRALLDGRKSQTRRQATAMWDRIFQAYTDDYVTDGPGIRLWVREAWRLEHFPEDEGPERCLLTWKANNRHEIMINGGHPAFPAALALTQRWRDTWTENEGWRPSIHMPRWASRITLRVTAIGLVRLQDISCEDALAEGSLEAAEVPYVGSMTCDQAVQAFSLLWDTLHTKPGTRWEDNPEVYRVAFEKVPQEDRNVR